MRLATGLLLLSMLFAVPGSPSASTEAGAPEQAADERMEEFVPTEEIPAGSAISFPVDI